MSNELRTLDDNIIASLVLNGDLKRLNPNQKVEYYNYRCQQAGLDPAAKPFDLLSLNGKEILYANATASQQLTANRNLNHTVTGRDLTDGIYCVFVKVTGQDGRSTENMGAVPIETLKGEVKANAMMKATTKAIRRSVLAHCGLGMMDETETETIPGAKKVDLPEIGANAHSQASSTPQVVEAEVVYAEPAAPNGWTLEAQGVFSDLTQNILFGIFKSGGHPDLFNKELDTWKARKNSDPADVVLKALEDRIYVLQSAAVKAKAKAQDPAATVTSQPSLPLDEPVSNVPAIGTPEYAKAASDALNKACGRFSEQGVRVEEANPKQYATDMRNKVLQTMAFTGNEHPDEKKFMLAAALQTKADELRIP